MQHTASDLRAQLNSFNQHILVASNIMSSTSNALILGDDAVEIYDPTSDIAQEYPIVGGAAYTKARVDNTDYPKSFYIVYDKTHYGTREGMATRSALVPKDPSSGSSETVVTNFPIVSCQGFDVRDPSIILFEHPDFTGNSMQYRSSRRNITSSFHPNDSWNGVSSIIITGGTWNLYGAKNLKAPLLYTLTKGTYRMKGGDEVQSVERIKM